MSTEPKQYRKRPVVVEAMLYDGTTSTCEPIHKWLGIDHYSSDEGCASGIYINTLEGVMHAQPGDFILRGIQGEFYPCKPDIFAETYEPAQQPGVRYQKVRSADLGEGARVGELVRSRLRRPHGAIWEVTDVEQVSAGPNYSYLRLHLRSLASGRRDTGHAGRYDVVEAVTS